MFLEVIHIFFLFKLIQLCTIRWTENFLNILQNIFIFNLQQAS